MNNPLNRLFNVFRKQPPITPAPVPVSQLALQQLQIKVEQLQQDNNHLRKQLEQCEATGNQLQRERGSLDNILHAKSNKVYSVTAGNLQPVTIAVDEMRSLTIIYAYMVSLQNPLVGHVYLYCKKDFAIVEELHVNDSVRRNAIGSILMNEAISHITRRGITVIRGNRVLPDKRELKGVTLFFKRFNFLVSVDGERVSIEKKIV